VRDGEQFTSFRLSHLLRMFDAEPPTPIHMASAHDQFSLQGRVFSAKSDGAEDQ
jgi:hypothetical protein